MTVPDLQTAVSKLQAILATGDVRAAVRFVNSLTPHRFTGLYLFKGPVLHNLYIFDKENPDTEALPDVPVTATYCAFTRRQEGALTIPNSMEDERFTDHPARQEVISYCGVPLVDRHGNVFGTTCHFDYKEVEISNDNVAVLEALAPLLSASRRAA